MMRKDILAGMGMKLPMHKQLRVIISSDVKNEADDQFAIVHQLLTPMFDVRGIVAAHFESKAPGSRTTMEQSYQELLKLLDAAGMEDVPAFRGCVSPLAGETDAPESEGVDFIIQEALREDERPLFITVQGAMTDVAAALNRCPEIGERVTVVWTGGQPYPHGGPEFNLSQDIPAFRALLASKAEVWQIPQSVYSSVEVTLAELRKNVYPYGEVGKYLYEQLEEYNYASDEPYELRKGENWVLGDSPVVSALLGCGWKNDHHMERAPVVQDDMTYTPAPNGKMLRVYDSVDTRMLLSDFTAKLALCYPAKAE